MSQQEIKARIAALQQRLAAPPRHDHDQKLDICNAILNLEVRLREVA